MRKHSVRKWLHAILDLLPVIILPIFAIYSHRHTIDSYEVTVPQNEVVNFNQIGYPKDLTDTDVYSDTGLVIGYTFSNTELQADNKYQINFYFDIEDVSVIYAYRVRSPYLSDNVPLSTGNNLYCYQFTAEYNDYLNIQLMKTNDLASDLTFSFSNFELFNLTQMFGSGNEPSIQQFNTWFPNDYYEYNTGTNQLLKGVSTITYDNTDIGSQMMYSLYKPINDYFNLNNVFNFGAIYDWFELNMFNGNAPLSIFIVWNIIVYEFIMDIIFLIYSVFMFVIDFACETLDRFTGWAKRGD